MSKALLFAEPFLTYLFSLGTGNGFESSPAAELLVVLGPFLFELEPWQRNVQKHEEDFNGGPAHVT